MRIRRRDIRRRTRITVFHHHAFYISFIRLLQIFGQGLGTREVRNRTCSLAEGGRKDVHGVAVDRRRMVRPPYHFVI